MKGENSKIARSLTAVLVAGLALIASINAVVDPLGIYRVLDVSGFNRSKPEIYTRVRVYKAFEVRRVRPRTIILGSSRTHLGLRCSHPALVKLEGPCYNLAFDGATTKEMYAYLVHAQTIQPLSHVILGLDSYHSSPAPAFTRPGFDPLLLYSPDASTWVRDLRADLRLLTSVDVLKLSLKTMFAQNTPDQKWFAPDGQRIGEIFFREVEPTFRSVGPRAYFDETDRREVENQLPSASPTIQKLGKRSEEELSSLSYISRIVSFCRAHKIDLRIFLTPAHAHQLEIAAALSGDQSIESGKRALVQLLADDAAQHQDESPVPLFDFSGYSSITTEPLTPFGSREEMEFYWDSSHFKNNVGDYVLDVLFQEEDPEHLVPHDFGTMLKADTLDLVIAQQRASQEAYRQARSQELASLHSLIPGLPIIVYHRIADGEIGDEDPSTIISAANFERQMQYLHEQGYHALNMDEVIQYLRGKPFPKKVVAIHFDDGWKSSKNALPILSRHGMKATFWIIVGAGHDQGSPHMDWNEIVELANMPNVDIFSHTMTHPGKRGDTLLDWVSGRLPGKGVEQVKWELKESRLELENRLNRRVSYLAWPSGIYNGDLIHLAQDAGYKALVTIDDGLNRPGGDGLRIHRTMVDGACDLDDFIGILSDGVYRNCPTRNTASINLSSSMPHE